MKLDFTFDDYKNGLCSADDYMASTWKGCTYVGMVDYKGHLYFFAKDRSHWICRDFENGMQDCEGNIRMEPEMDTWGARQMFEFAYDECDSFRKYVDTDGRCLLNEEA